MSHYPHAYYAIRAHLDQHGHLTCHDVMLVRACSQLAARKHIARALKHGIIRRVRRGVYGRVWEA